MKKRSKKRHIRFKATTYYQSSTRPTIEIEPEEAVVHIRRAEKEVLPMIQQMHIPPAPAFFLLAQYAQAFMTGDTRLSIESATEITNTVLMLWQTGVYTPSSEYPYTLEETLRDAQGEQKPERSYAEWFQPFLPTSASASPSNIGKVAAGLVKHPETHLWQIWVILDGPCDYLGAYREVERAQHALQVFVDALRRVVAPHELVHIVSTQIMSLSDGDVKQLPFAMMEYLLEHRDAYTIQL